MENISGPQQPVFTQISVSTMMPSTLSDASRADDAQQRHTEMMYVLNMIAEQQRQLVSAQKNHNELLRQLIGSITAGQRQRQHELQQWKEENPEIAKKCREALDALLPCQMEYLSLMAYEVSTEVDAIKTSEFAFNDFIDKFGARTAQLGTLVQMLSQLAAPEITGPSSGKSDEKNIKMP